MDGKRIFSLFVFGLIFGLVILGIFLAPHVLLALTVSQPDYSLHLGSGGSFATPSDNGQYFTDTSIFDGQAITTTTVYDDGAVNADLSPGTTQYFSYCNGATATSSMFITNAGYAATPNPSVCGSYGYFSFVNSTSTGTGAWADVFNTGSQLYQLIIRQPLLSSSIRYSFS